MTYVVVLYIFIKLIIRKRDVHNMANIIDLTTAKTLVITNVVKSEEVMNSPVGERVILPFGEIKDDIEKGKYVDFEYALDVHGNFQKAAKITAGEPQVVIGYKLEDFTGSVTDNEVAVIVRKSIKATDRYIQFYRTQQKILLAQNEAIKISVTNPAEYAHYMSLAAEGEITVAEA